MSRPRRTVAALIAGVLLATALAVAPAAPAFAKSKPKPPPVGTGTCTTDPTGTGCTGTIKLPPACGAGGVCKGNNGTNNTNPPTTPTTTDPSTTATTVPQSTPTTIPLCTSSPNSSGGINASGACPSYVGYSCQSIGPELKDPQGQVVAFTLLLGKLVVTLTYGLATDYGCQIYGFVTIVVPPSKVQKKSKGLLKSVTAEAFLPTIWAMPSKADPASRVFAVASTAQDQVAWANRPVWLGVEPGPHVSSVLSDHGHKCESYTVNNNTVNVCAHIVVTLTPEYVDFSWDGTGHQVYGNPVITMQCSAAPGSLVWAPPVDTAETQATDQQPSMVFQYAGGKTVYGGPGCSTNAATALCPPNTGHNCTSSAAGGGPVYTPYGPGSTLGGVLAEPAYTPTNATKQDCLNQAGGDNPSSPNWQTWCNNAPLDATVKAWVVYHVTWVYNPASARPPGLPSRVDGPTQTIQIPVLAQHVTLSFPN
ncbi:MAG: hypothetical protein ACYCST_04565 [Acidimicrobiales bacterium]